VDGRWYVQKRLSVIDSSCRLVESVTVNLSTADLERVVKNRKGRGLACALVVSSLMTDAGDEPRESTVRASGELALDTVGFDWPSASSTSNTRPIKG
jgi:hypothetical protein